MDLGPSALGLEASKGSRRACGQTAKRWNPYRGHCEHTECCGATDGVVAHAMSLTQEMGKHAGFRFRRRHDRPDPCNLQRPGGAPGIGLFTTEELSS